METQPKRITSGRLIAAGVVLGTAALGSGFAGHSESHSADTGTNNTLKVSNVDINSIHAQDPNYVSIDKQMEALSKKQTSVKVEITEKGESLTEATAKTFGESNDQAFSRLQKNGLAENDLVYVGDTFELPADNNGEITGGNIQSESLSQLRVVSESTGQESDANLEATSADCIQTDLKGTAVYSGDHISGDPVQFDLQNVQPAERQDCPDGVWVRSYASNQNPNSAGWLESQSPMTSQVTIHNSDGSITRTSTAEGMVTIPNDTNDLKVEVDLPDGDYCWAQVETVRTSDLLQPPYYNGDKMVDYVLVSNPTKRNPDTCEVVKTATATASPTVTFTPTVTSTPLAECFPTDVKGTLEYTGNHVAGMKVKGHFENVSTNPACPDKFWVDIYGSDEPVSEGSNWLETQHFNQQFEFEVKAGEKKDIEVNIENVDDCFYQTDAVRISEKLLPPRFNGVNMIDYTITKDVDSCLPATASPTATASPAFTFTSTPPSTEVSTNTPVPPTRTSVPPTRTHVPPTETPTAMPTEKAVETPPPAVVMPKSGSGPLSKDFVVAPWINFAAGASALGLIGLGFVKRGFETLVTDGDEGKKKKNKKIESKS